MGNAVFANRATAQLASAITSGAASLTVTAGKGALFPVATGNQYFGAVIQKGALDTDAREYVYCRRAAGSDTITLVARAQDGSVAQAFAAGDVIARVVLAGELAVFAQRDGDTSLASAATTDLYTSSSEDVVVTGTTGITSFGTAAPEGTVRNVRWTNAAPGALTHGTAAGNPRLPLGLSITPRQNERYTFRKNADGTWWLESHNAATVLLYGVTLDADSRVVAIAPTAAKHTNLNIAAPTAFVPCLSFSINAARVWQINATSKDNVSLYNYDAAGANPVERLKVSGDGHVTATTGGMWSKQGFIFDGAATGLFPTTGVWTVSGPYRQNTIANTTPGQGDTSILSSFHQTGVESFMQINQGGSGNIFRFLNNGQGASSAGWVTISDRWAKKKIRPLDRVRERVLGVPVVLFNWRNDPDARDVIGTISQAAGRSSPEVVKEITGVSFEKKVGEQPDGTPIMKRMRARKKTRIADYDQLGMIALAGTQEQYRIIDLLLERLEKAERRIAELEAACSSK